MTQADRARLFRELHVPGTPLVLFNAWDAGSAIAVERAGAPAVATGSFGIAGALGYADGEACPYDEGVFVAGRICKSVGVPVTHDIERGFGDTPEAVAASVQKALKVGVVGFNIEDSLGNNAGLRHTEAQCDRLRAARAAMDDVAPGAFLNARTDVFAGRTPPTTDLADAVIERAEHYAKAGADGLFVPFLGDLGIIADICARSPLPVNILRSMEGPKIEDLAAAGVARISHGHVPWFVAMTGFEDAAREIYAA